MSMVVPPSSVVPPRPYGDEPAEERKKMLAFAKGLPNLDPAVQATVDAPRRSPLAEQFNLTQGPATPKSMAGDAAARARVLSSAPASFLDVLPSERDRNDYNANPDAGIVTPTRDESAREDAYVQHQVANTQADEARRRAEVMAEQQYTQEAQKLAAERAFFERTGMPYDPKIAAELQKQDRESAEYQGSFEDIAAMTREMQAKMQADPGQAKAIEQQYLERMRQRLWTYGIRAGKSGVGSPWPNKSQAGLPDPNNPGKS